MPSDNWLSLRRRLRTAIKKIRFLLNLNVNRWRLASMIGASPSNRRRLSFNDRPGLKACADDDDDDNDSIVSVSPHQLQRTSSCLSPTVSDDDVDKKADLFIANFYRQLRMERQISLELRYCRGNSFDSISP